MRVLVVNAGSSSLKLALLDSDDVVDSAHVENWQGDTDALRDFVDSADFDAVGHRVVHGGWDLTEPVVVDRDVERAIETAGTLAPLHQPRALAGIRAVRRLVPDAPAVACFDTAFHRHLPRATATYALPRDWRERWAIRRFGFHGLSHEYAAGRTAQLLQRPLAGLRTVVCHLGSGASLCAVDGGRSVDTTMGFTPLEGLVMGTRAGSVDPGILIWLQTEAGMSVDALHDGLETESGLQGLAGTADLQVVLSRREDGDSDASMAVDVYLQRLVSSIAAMAASMDGLDAVCFTGGIGQHSPWVREQVLRRLSWIGLGVDTAVNGACTSDGVVSPPGAAVAAVTVTAREDLQVARHARQALAAHG
jgi:acetate kinase